LDPWGFKHKGKTLRFSPLSTPLFFEFALGEFLFFFRKTALQFWEPKSFQILRSPAFSFAKRKG